MASLPPPAIRHLTPNDLGECMELTVTVGWNQLREDWETILSLRPDGCFAACLDGRIVGTATTTAYGDAFGWIGMVIVHPEYRRRGIGRALLEECIASLGHCAAARLDATPNGKQLYDGLGFVDEYLFGRYVAARPAIPPPTAGPAPVPMAEADLPEVVAFDRPAFGTDRSAVLSAWLRRTPDCALVARDGGRIVGYCMGRPGLNYATIGPVVARDEGVARALVGVALARIGPRPVVLDAFEHSPDFLEWLGELGFAKQRPFIRMYRGINSHPGETGRVFAVCGPEVG